MGERATLRRHEGTARQGRRGHRRRFGHRTSTCGRDGPGGPCSLALSDVDEGGLAETAAGVQQLGAKVTTTRLDVADREAVYRHAEEVVANHGAAHLVFNNAGVALGAGIAEVGYDDFAWLMNINFWGVVHGTKAFLPHLKRADEGHVVNISSVFGLIRRSPSRGPTTPPSSPCAASPSVCARSSPSPEAGEGDLRPPGGNPHQHRAQESHRGDGLRVAQPRRDLRGVRPAGADVPGEGRQGHSARREARRAPRADRRRRLGDRPGAAAGSPPAIRPSSSGRPCAGGTAPRPWPPGSSSGSPCWAPRWSGTPTARPSPTPRSASLSFFVGWLEAELAIHHILWQGVRDGRIRRRRRPGPSRGLARTRDLPGLLGGAGPALRAGLARRRSARVGTPAWTGARVPEPDPAGAARDPDRRGELAGDPGALPDRFPGVQRDRDIRFARQGPVDLKLDLYRPRDADPGKPLPVFFYVHGGGWVIGDKATQGLPLMAHVAARGWIGVNVNYRLSPHATFPDHLIDVKRALHWVAEGRAGLRLRPRADRRVRRVGRGAPRLAARADGERSRVPARVRGRGHDGPGVRAHLRRLRLHRERSRLATPGHAALPGAPRDEGQLRRRSDAVPEGVARPPNRARRPALPGDPRRLRLPGARGRGPGLRGALAGDLSGARGLRRDSRRPARLRDLPPLCAAT